MELWFNFMFLLQTANSQVVLPIWHKNVTLIGVKP